MVLGPAPTLIAFPGMLVAVLMGVTVLARKLATYAVAGSASGPAAGAVALAAAPLAPARFSPASTPAAATTAAVRAIPVIMNNAPFGLQ
jgi:hypothetical protein